MLINRPAHITTRPAPTACPCLLVNYFALLPKLSSCPHVSDRRKRHWSAAAGGGTKTKNNIISMAILSRLRHNPSSLHSQNTFFLIICEFIHHSNAIQKRISQRKFLHNSSLPTKPRCSVGDEILIFGKRDAEAYFCISRTRRVAD